MKHQVYVSYCTEYEAGFGQRPDGFLITESLEAMEREITESNKSGSYGCYWRYNEPELVYCDDETYAKIKEKMAEKDYANYCENKKKELILFKKI